MKLLCMTGGYLPSIGGMQYSNHETMIGLVENGIEITLVCPHVEGDKIFDKTLPFEMIRMRKGGYLNQMKNIFLVNKLFKDGKYDEVMLMGHCSEIAFGIFKSFLSFKPIILAAGTRLRFENNKHIVRIRNFILKRAYNSAKKIIAINEHTIQSIHEYCNTPINLFTKIPRPINSKIWKLEKKINTKIFTIVTFCRIEKEKNIQDVIKILSNLKRKGYRFIYNIIGDGKYLYKIKEFTKYFKIENEVIFHGKKSQNEIVKILHQCDLHILLSESESFGRVFAEAGFIKVPSIGYLGYESSAVSEIIKHNYNGFVYKFGEFHKIEEKIIEIMNDDNYLQKLSKNALHFSKSNFDSKIVSKKFSDFLYET